MLIKCDYCGEKYYIRPSHFKRKNHHFCSRTCYGNWERGENNPAWKNNYIACEFCGEEFKPKSSDTRYCSRKCMGAADHERNSCDVSCQYCSKEFSSINARDSKYCSIECKDLQHSINMKGDGNPNYLGVTKKGYSSSFNKELKHQIKTRDNFVCVLCGLPDEDNFCGNGYGLSIHHIDYDKANNELSNLVSLCNICHAKTNYNRESWKKVLSQK